MKLEDKIETLRDILYSSLQNKELTDVYVVNCSQELDRLLLQYEQKINLKAKNYRNNWFHSNDSSFDMNK